MQVMNVGICRQIAASMEQLPRAGGGSGGRSEVGGSEGRGEGQGPRAAPPESTPLADAVQTSPSSSWRCNCSLVPEAGPRSLCPPCCTGLVLVWTLCFSSWFIQGRVGIFQ